MDTHTDPLTSTSRSAVHASRFFEHYGLFLLLFALSLLAWSGTFGSSDGLSMYAVTDSLVRYGRWETEQLRWMGWQQGTYGPDGLLYSRKGLATSVLAWPLAWLGLHGADMGAAQAALLLTPLLHALTGVYLYATVRRVAPGAGRGGALGVAALWAFASPALPYVKTFFSEPAVALSLAAAGFHLRRFRGSGALRDATALGAWLGLSLLTRSANAILLPGFGLALLAYTYTHHVQQRRRALPWRAWGRWLLHEWTVARGLAFGLPIGFSLALSFWYNWHRFGNPLASGYIAGEEFSGDWLAGILGQTVSPGRGLIWYAPWLVLAAWGAWRWWRTERVLVALVGSSVLLYILFYGKWYLWSGGFAWGPRFLIPVLPLLALLVAPLVERGRTGRSLVALGGALGLAVNLVGVLWSFNLQQAALDAAGFPLFAPETFWDPRYAQIPHLLALGRATPAALDLAWMVGGAPERRLLALTVGVVLAGVGAGLWGWRKRHGAAMASVGTGMMLVGLWLLLGDLRAFQAPLLQDALALLPQPLPREAQLWYDDPAAAQPVMDQVKQAVPIIGFNVGGEVASPEEDVRARALAATARGSVFLVSDGPDRLHHALDLILLDNLFWVGETDVGHYRVAEYWSGPLAAPIPYDLRLAFPDGPALALREVRVTPEVTRGYILALLLRWQAETPLPPDTQLFLHLRDASGERVLQQDRAPTQGRRPPETWLPGDLVTDRHALRLPPELAPGPYTLHLGLYRLSDGARATTADGQSEWEIPIQVR